MKVAAAVAVFTLCFLATACPSSAPPKAIAVVKAGDVIPFIKDANLTRPVAFDGGKLRLDPISGKPKLTEQAALKQWLYTAGSFPGGVVVVFVRAQLRIPVSVDQNIGVQPRTFPRFNGRPAWAVFWYASGPFSCPSFTSGQRPQRSRIPAGTPASQSVLLLAGDGSNEAVVYSSAGRTGGCIQTVTPAVASTAWYVYSAPWRIGRVGYPHTSLIANPPPCSALWSTQSGGSHTSGTFTVLMKKLMVTGTCATDKAALTLDYERQRGPTGLPAISKITHPPVGPTLWTFEPPTIKYFDGATRQFKTS